MNKKTILLISLAVLLAGGLIITEFVYTVNKAAEIPMPGNLNLSEPNPEKETPLELKPEGMVTFLLSSNDIIYYYTGKFNGNIIKTDFTKVGEVIKKYNETINKDDLMFVIKSGEKATFKNAIDILDQMTINDIPPGHYAEVDITEKEIESIKKFKE